MEKLTITEIKEMFQNGEQRYELDAYFKEAVTAINAGVGITAVLDRVLKEHTILMRLHNEALNKNRDLVSECARLSDEVASYKDALELLTEKYNAK
jgi:hypothetical protein